MAAPADELPQMNNLHLGPPPGFEQRFAERGFLVQWHAENDDPMPNEDDCLVFGEFSDRQMDAIVDKVATMAQNGATLHCRISTYTFPRHKPPEVWHPLEICIVQRCGVGV